MHPIEKDREVYTVSKQAMRTSAKRANAILQRTFNEMTSASWAAGYKEATEQLTKRCFVPPKLDGYHYRDEPDDVWLSPLPERLVVELTVSPSELLYSSDCDLMSMRAIRLAFQASIRSEQFEMADRGAIDGKRRIVVRWPEWRRVR